MKISKKRIKEILSEEIKIFIKENSHPGPNYSPKLGVNLVQFIDELIGKQLTDVEFVKEEGDKMVFSTSTPAENKIVQDLDAKVLDDGSGNTILYFEKEEGVVSV